MNDCRLVVMKGSRMLGTFEPAAHLAEDDLKSVASLFSQEPGLTVQWEKLHGERRLLESTPDGLRVLSVEKLYKPATSK